VNGDSFEEEPMTAAPHLTELSAVEQLLGRDDLTVDDIADLPEDLRYELIDGRLVLTPLALPTHQLFGLRVGAAIDERCPDDFVVNIEQAVLISRRNELHPDVVVLREEASLSSPVLPSDVPLLVEILSKSTANFDRHGKLKKYAEIGIPSYWIFDPMAAQVTFTQYTLNRGGGYDRVVHTTEMVTVEDPWKITLDLPVWTARLNRMRRAAARRRK
jgi:Uma2 family endonuclease